MPDVRIHQLTPKLLAKDITPSLVNVGVSRVSETLDEGMTAEQLGFVGPVTHVKAYGTDAASVMAAIAATPTGGTLFFEQGTYDVSTGWTNNLAIDKKIHITGEPGAVIVGPQTTDNMFQINTGGHVLFENVEVQYFYAVFRFQTSVDHDTLIVRGCKFDGSRFVINGSGSSYQRIKRMVFDRNECVGELRPMYRAVYIEWTDWDQIQVTNNHITKLSSDDKTTGVKIGNDTPGNASDGQCEISNNYFEDIETTTAQIDCHAVWLNASSPNVSNNTIINVRNSSGGVIDNCEAIYVKSVRPVIANNLVIDAGHEAFIQYKGITPVSGTRMGTIHGNQCHKTASHLMEHLGGDGGYGIAATGPCTITANSIQGLTKGIYLSGAEEGSVCNNLISRLDNPTGDHISTMYIYNCANVTVADNVIKDINHSAGGAVYGIRIRSTTGGPLSSYGLSTVTGNVITNTTSSSSTANAFYYIQSSNGVPLTHITFANNRIDGCKRGFQTVTEADLSDMSWTYNDVTNATDYAYDANIHTIANAKVLYYDNNLDAQAGANSPVGVVTPFFVGNQYLDAVTNEYWQAHGTNNTDWKMITNQPGTGYTSGAGSPVTSVTPGATGEVYFDTTHKEWYQSTGLTNSDWRQTSNNTRVLHVPYHTSLAADVIGAGATITLFTSPGLVRGSDTPAPVTLAGSGVFQINHVDNQLHVIVELQPYTLDNSLWMPLVIMPEVSADGSTGWLNSSADENLYYRNCLIPPADLTGLGGGPFTQTTVLSFWFGDPTNSGYPYLRFRANNPSAGTIQMKWANANFYAVEDY